MPKMRWDCERQGCFNRVKRPKIEMFDDCFPGAIAFGDVDARVEINGCFLELEWKPDKSSLKRGQRLAFERITKEYPENRYIVLVVVGNAETMVVECLAVIREGIVGPWERCDFDELHVRISDWATAAKKRRIDVRGGLANG